MHTRYAHSIQKIENYILNQINTKSFMQSERVALSPCLLNKKLVECTYFWFAFALHNKTVEIIKKKYSIETLKSNCVKENRNSSLS